MRGRDPISKGVQLLKVLLADDNEERAGAVADRLRAEGVSSIVMLGPGVRLVDAVRAETPDVVIVDMSRPDRDSLRSIRELSHRAPAPVVMFVDQDDAGFMEQAIDAGVSSYNVIGRGLPEVKPLVQAAVAIFRRYRRVAEGLERAEAQLREREVISRAKSRLMAERKLSEPEAHKYLRQSAMNCGKRIVEIATELLRQGEV